MVALIRLDDTAIGTAARCSMVALIRLDDIGTEHYWHCTDKVDDTAIMHPLPRCCACFASLIGLIHDSSGGFLTNPVMHT